MLKIGNVTKSKLVWVATAPAALLGLIGCEPAANVGTSPASTPTILSVPVEGTSQGAAVVLTPTQAGAADLSASEANAAAAPTTTPSNSATAPNTASDALPMDMDMDMVMGTVRPGESQTLDMPVDDADTVTFYMLSFSMSMGVGGPGAGTADPPTLTLSVRGPDGKLVSPDNMTQSSYCIPIMMGYSCYVEKPAPGTWQVIVSSAKGSASGEDIGFSVQTQFTGGVEVIGEFGKEDAIVGQAVEVKVTLQDPAPLSGATVDAFTVVMMGSYTAMITMTEQGGGVYTGQFTPPAEGDYDVVITANGRNNRGHVFARRDTKLLRVRPN